jgi:hypothetical protein
MKRSAFMAMFVGGLAALASGSIFGQNALEPKYPDVIAAKASLRGVDIFDFEVTMTSPYDTAQRYADAFRIVDSSGKIFGERVLLHDHADEQPFTRDLGNVRIPKGVRTVVVQGRDQKSGYGGKTVELVLPGR